MHFLFLPFQDSKEEEESKSNQQQCCNDIKLAIDLTRVGVGQQAQPREPRPLRPHHPRHRGRLQQRRARRLCPRRRGCDCDKQRCSREVAGAQPPPQRLLGHGHQRQVHQCPKKMWFYLPPLKKRQLAVKSVCGSFEGEAAPIAHLSGATEGRSLVQQHNPHSGETKDTLWCNWRSTRPAPKTLGMCLIYSDGALQCNLQFLF